MQNENSFNPTFNYIIPSAVLRTEEDKLSDKAKLLYGIINALSEKYGYCCATNSYIQKYYGYKLRTIARCLTQLKNIGLIKIVHENNNPYKRKIYIEDIKTFSENKLQKTSQTYATDGAQQEEKSSTSSATSGTRGTPSMTPSYATDGKRGVPNTACDHAISGAHNISNNISIEYKGLDSSLSKEEESKPIPKDIHEVQNYMDTQTASTGFNWKCTSEEFFEFMKNGNWTIHGQEQKNWKTSLWVFNAKKSIRSNKASQPNNISSKSLQHNLN